MSLLLNCQKLTKYIGARPLFQDLSFSIFSKDRLGLIGPNGSGKSTLLKTIIREEELDSGLISPRKGLKIGYVPQVCDFPDQSLLSILLKACGDESNPHQDKELLARTWLSKLGFKEEQASGKNLSGGWKKRLSLACALVSSPDLLLLDEPTNHLDLEGIVWLEKFLTREVDCYIVVSHDRYFLEQVVNRVLEIDRTYPEGLFGMEGSYEHFLEKKAGFLSGQIEQQRSLASKARRELDWIRQSPKARTTKATSRITEANLIFEELANLQDRNRKRTSGIDFAATERETQKLLSVKNLSKEINGKLFFKGLDFILSPGTRLGLVGPNGSGKTTLLKILAGEVIPDQGTVKKADALKVVYFDQHRMQLPDHTTLKEALCPQGEFVNFRGQSIHVNGWCKRFLFSPDLLGMQIGSLSGGERARISIANLMQQPADLLLLDEPTNDLDIPTLETLESSLNQFPGAIVLISHDRSLLDKTCNQFLALGDPETNTLFADYKQWENTLNFPSSQVKGQEKVAKDRKSNPKKGLTYLEKKEYDQIENKIELGEEELQALHSSLENTSNTIDPVQLQAICNRIPQLELEIEQLYKRWDELEKKLLQPV